MNNTTLTIRTTEDLKNEASKLYESMGINLSIAVNIFMKQSILKKRFPCSLDVSVASELTNMHNKKLYKLFGLAKNSGFDEEPEDISVSLDGEVNI